MPSRTLFLAPFAILPLLAQTAREEMVPMRDGIKLATSIYLPPGDGPFPVVLTRTPYGKDAMYGPAAHKQFLEHGYVRVVQDVRGKFKSEGKYAAFVDDIDDGYDTVEWIAKQPWSNGKVGMFGTSYSGFSQLMAAIARPPHLVAIAPMSCSWTFADNSWYFAPGVLSLGLAIWWSAMMTAWEATRRGLPLPIPEFAEADGDDVEQMTLQTAMADLQARAKLLGAQRDSCVPLFDRRPLRDIEELRDLAPWFRDWCDHDDQRHPYWRQVNAADHLGAIDLPILHLVVRRGYDSAKR
jgi:uncharacterized protein